MEETKDYNPPYGHYYNAGTFTIVQIIRSAKITPETWEKYAVACDCKSAQEAERLFGPPASRIEVLEVKVPNKNIEQFLKAYTIRMENL